MASFALFIIVVVIKKSILTYTLSSTAIKFSFFVIITRFAMKLRISTFTSLTFKMKN